MTDYSHFEASLKSGVHTDPKRIRKKDEIIAPVLRGTRRFLLSGLVFLAASMGFTIFFVYRIFFSNDGVKAAWQSFAAPGILLLAALFCIWRFFRRKKLYGGGLRDYYEEGLLAGGMIVDVKPLTLMVLASLTACDGEPERYGCYKLTVRELEGAKGELYEKIPCSCFFRYESGSYHDAFQPHPLYWGTTDQGGIDRALEKVEASDRKYGQDTWGVIRRVAEKFPNLKNGQLVILDENYEPIGIRYFWQSGLDKIGSEESRDGEADSAGNNSQRAGNGCAGMETTHPAPEYHKKPQEPELNMRQDKPGREVYERFAALACRHEVYDYFTGHCSNGSIALSSHPGFFSCIGDPVTFPQELKERKISLQSGEYPLFLGKYLATNKGLYRKKDFIPWREAQITFKVDFADAIKVYVNGKYCSQFGPDVQGYEDSEQIPEEKKGEIARLEVKRLEEFFQDIRENGI